MSLCFWILSYHDIQIADHFVKTWKNLLIDAVPVNGRWFSLVMLLLSYHLAQSVSAYCTRTVSAYPGSTTSTIEVSGLIYSTCIKLNILFSPFYSSYRWRSESSRIKEGWKDSRKNWTRIIPNSIKKRLYLSCGNDANAGLILDFLKHLFEVNLQVMLPVLSYSLWLASPVWASKVIYIKLHFVPCCRFGRFFYI